jgi:hypothetical protein
MKVAIMQPYFLPYLGYWQLIRAVDKFVVLDDVNFINRGWINRNRIAVDGKPVWMTLPLVGASQNKLICEIDLLPDDGWRDRLAKMVGNAYKKTTSYPATAQIFQDLLDGAQGNLSDFLAGSIQRICGFLGIVTEIIPTSRIFPKGELKGQQRILDICERLGAKEYLNPPGGRELYNAELFDSRGIKLMFLGSPSAEIGLKSGSPCGDTLSLLDTMMTNPLDAICKAVSAFEFQH